MKFKVYNMSYSSSYKRKKIYAKLYVPQGDIRGVIQITHGMCEHINRYKEFMSYLATCGYVVCGHDDLGHGKTASSSSELGFFAQKNGYKYLVKDVYRLNRIMSQRYPNKPYFLFGHDMGSYISRLYAIKFPNTINGLILSGTSGKNLAVDVAIKGIDELIEIHEPEYRSYMIDKAIAKLYNHRYTSPITQKDWLSRERTVIDAYMKDPLCNFTFTLSGLRDLYILQKYSNQNSWYKALDNNLPILILSGSMDPVGGYSKGVVGVYKNLKNNDFSDITLNLYPNTRHEVLNDIDKYKVFVDVKNWIEDTLEIWKDILQK